MATCSSPAWSSKVRLSSRCGVPRCSCTRITMCGWTTTAICIFTCKPPAMTETPSEQARLDHPRDHPELAPGDLRRNVRGLTQDGDERDHLRGAGCRHRHHGCRG